MKQFLRNIKFILILECFSYKDVLRKVETKLNLSSPTFKDTGVAIQLN